MTRFAVIGAGNAGFAVAAHLNLEGAEVTLCDVAEEQLAPVMENDNMIEVTGDTDLNGHARIELLTTDLVEAIQGAELVICTTPAHTHRLVAGELAGALRSEQVVALNPGRTGGALEFRRVLDEKGAGGDPLVVETETLLYGCRKRGTSVNIFGIKSRVRCAGLPKERSDRFFELVQPYIAQFEPAPGIWHTSLNNIGMLFHPTPTLLNLGRMEFAQPFEYYVEGISPSIAHLIERLDEERLGVAEAMGVELPSAMQWLREGYGARGDTLFEALQANPAYRGIQAPLFQSREETLKVRYVVEDVPTGLVPVSELGRRAGRETPAMDAVIELANLIFGTDFRAEGRTLRRLGLGDLSIADIRAL